MAKYGIMAHRGAASILGAASAWAKHTDGSRIEFEDAAAAQLEALRLNQNIRSANVWYQVKPLAEERS